MPEGRSFGYLPELQIKVADCAFLSCNDPVVNVTRQRHSKGCSAVCQATEFRSASYYQFPFTPHMQSTVCELPTGNEILQKMDLGLLICDNRFDQIPNRKDPIQLAVFEHRQVATPLFGQ